MKLVEPLRELFKARSGCWARSSACRKASSAAIPSQVPAFAIRCPGGITREKLDILREADAIYLDEIRKAGLYDAIWQAFGFLPAGARRSGFDGCYGRPTSSYLRTARG